MFRRSILLFVLMAMIFSGCNSAISKFKSSSDKSSRRSASNADEAFDPLILKDEDIDFPEIGSAEETVAGTQSFNSGQGNNQQLINKKIDGFRIQLFASKDIEKTTFEKKKAEVVFGPAGFTVYIEFDSPMYKIRVGDCRTREEAEQLQRLSRSNGYPTAWIVKTKVYTNPELPQQNN